MGQDATTYHSTGGNGGILAYDTTAHTPGTGVQNFMAIQALTDTVFTTLTDSNITDMSAANVGTLAAGHTIYGNFTAVTLTSGIAMIYNR